MKIRHINNADRIRDKRPGLDISGDSVIYVGWIVVLKVNVVLQRC